MGNSNRMRWLTAGLVLVLIGVAAWGYGQYQDARDYKIAAENSRQQAFYNLLERVENLDVLTAKALVSSDATQTTLMLADVWRHATVAVEDLSRLPLAHFELTNTARFLSQVGDYAHTLAQRSANNQELTDQQWDELLDIRRRVGKLHEQLREVEQRASKGELRWVDLAREANRKLPQSRPEPLDADMAEMEKQVQKFPELIYDGPFSDHLVNRKPKGLTGPDVSAEQASEIARRFMFGEDAEEFDLDYQGKTEGLIPAHSFRYEEAEGTPIVTDVSVKGGKVIFMLRSRQPEEANLSVDEAVEQGLQFLESRGLKSMKPTYRLRQGNTAVISYAYVQEGVIIYSDLIKVKVALDNGQIVSYEAMGYLMNHQDRQLPDPQLTIDEAAAKLDNRLNVVNRRVALIPLPDAKEALTYEFQVELNGDDFLSYIDATTGEEVQILQIIHAPEGDLTQ